MLASIGEAVDLWRVSDGALLRTLEGRKVEGQDDYIGGIAFSPDGQTLFMADTLTRRVGENGFETVSGILRTWRVSDWTVIRSWENKDGIYEIHISPDGQLLVGESKDSILVLRASDDALLQTLKPDSLFVTDMAFSPDGRLMALGSWDNTVQLWGVR